MPGKGKKQALVFGSVTVYTEALATQCLVCGIKLILHHLCTHSPHPQPPRVHNSCLHFTPLGKHTCGSPHPQTSLHQALIPRLPITKPSSPDFPSPSPHPQTSHHQALIPRLPFTKPSSPDFPSPSPHPQTSHHFTPLGK